MKRTTLSCVVLVTLWATAALSQQNLPKNETLSENDYAVYTALVQDLFPDDKFETLVLIEHTSAGFPPGMAAWTSVGRNAQELMKGNEDLQEPFESRNHSHVMLQKEKITTRLKVVLLSSEAASKLVEKDGSWGDFRKRYPKSPGIVLVSLPAYSASGDRALVYVGNSCDSLCGQGTLLVLSRESGAWKVLKKAAVWLS